MSEIPPAVKEVVAEAINRHTGHILLSDGRTIEFDTHIDSDGEFCSREEAVVVTATDGVYWWVVDLRQFEPAPTN